MPAVLLQLELNEAHLLLVRFQHPRYNRDARVTVAQQLGRGRFLRLFAPGEELAHQPADRVRRAGRQFVAVGQLQRCRGQRQAGAARVLVLT